MSALHAVVLGGGTARRLGGASKPDLAYRGGRLLEHVLAGLAEAMAGVERGGGRVVVVAPGQVAVPAGVLRTMEDPPRSGPVAGIFAALAAADARDGDLVFVLACDAPGGPAALPALLGAVGDGDGAIGVDADGRDQYLLAVFAVEALRRRAREWGDLAGAPVKKFVAPLCLNRVPLPAEVTRDIDTWQDLAHHESTRGQP